MEENGDLDGELDGDHNAATEAVREGSNVDFWVEQIRLVEAVDAMESNSDSEGSATIPNYAIADSDSYQAGYDYNYMMDTPTLPFNAHSVSGFYFSDNAQSRPNWVTNINLIDPNYTVPDPIPDEATNIHQEWVKKLKKYRSAKCKLADCYGVTALCTLL
jgi:hypothetical protein